MKKKKEKNKDSTLQWYKDWISRTVSSHAVQMATIGTMLFSLSCVPSITDPFFRYAGVFCLGAAFGYYIKGDV